MAPFAPMNTVRRIGGILAGWLPARLWPSLELYVPVASSAIVSGLLTMLAGFAIGLPGFLEHAGGQSRGYIDLLVNAADEGKYVTRDLAVGMNAVSIFTFLLLTPKGWATGYLVMTGLLRWVSAWFDEPRGDPLLTLADAGVRRLAGGRRTRRAARHRAEQEGPESRDIVVTGVRAGIPQAELVIVSSRRKPGWDEGTVVITPGTTYRIGAIVERTVEGRLRTFYPLTEHRDFEAFRRVVHYELPS